MFGISSLYNYGTEGWEEPIEVHFLVQFMLKLLHDHLHCEENSSPFSSEVRGQRYGVGGQGRDRGWSFYREQKLQRYVTHAP